MIPVRFLPAFPILRFSSRVTSSSVRYQRAIGYTLQPTVSCFARYSTQPEPRTASADPPLPKDDAAASAKTAESFVDEKLQVVDCSRDAFAPPLVLVHHSQLTQLTSASHPLHTRPPAWLRAADPPRIEQYPYPPPSPTFSFLDVFPVLMQREFCKWIASRLLSGNTSETYFPDQFLLGGIKGLIIGVRYSWVCVILFIFALKNLSNLSFSPTPSLPSFKATLSLRRVLTTLTTASTILSPASASETPPTLPSDLSEMLTPALHNRLLTELMSLPHQTRIRLSLPAIHDATIRDVWAVLGPQQASTNPQRFTDLRWMTMQLWMRRVREKGDEESIREYRDRNRRGLLEGCGFKVDVEVDAEVLFEVVRVKGEEDEEVILRDRTRRPVVVRFETPYFEPATPIQYPLHRSSSPRTRQLSPPSLDPLHAFGIRFRHNPPHNRIRHPCKREMEHVGSLPRPKGRIDDISRHANLETPMRMTLSVHYLRR
ncbi:hypothetical protein BC936DRAFT_149304 [Jimgerdemannia flammicorona]|uniref:Uncharacterized protein n=1 Tax=Jimgerdemannia flammicorona TaxID=994334 RepID=A0A433D137_9FUNG|nr:hypothetical protein BC936DRAFT_149304 [Jimgerdemannia flammicorona]